MIKTIFLIFIFVIGLPLYAICVAFLLLLEPIFGWSYIDASVYVCEYVQPVFTAILTCVFLCFCVRNTVRAFRNRKTVNGLALSVISLSYISIGVYCLRELAERIAAYEGMSNHRIFYYVVHKLQVMGADYPDGAVRLFNGNDISYGYIMANVEVYIMPISLVLLLGLIQWLFFSQRRARKSRK